MFKVKQLKVFDFVNNSKDKKNLFKTFIVYYNKQGGVEPHLISKYVDINFGNTSLNTQKKYAEEIKKFLNFLIEHNLFPEFFSDLTLKEGAEYLKNISFKVQSNEIQSRTFYYIENRLLHFYQWLSINKIVKEEIVFNTKSYIMGGITKTSMVSPFKRLDFGIAYPPNTTKGSTRLHDFGLDRSKYIKMFINLTEIYAPDILIGVYMQFFGGLRAGEVVNLRRRNIVINKVDSLQPIIISVEDNWSELLDRYSNVLDSQVKKSRDQSVFYIKSFKKALEKHMKKLDDLGISEEGPLIISFTRKKALNGQNYKYRFDKVKKRFIEILKITDEEGYRYFTSKNWSTHIGRGIYTNILKFEMNLDASQMRLFRGDSSITSSEVYIEKINSYELIDKHIEKLDELLK